MIEAEAPHLARLRQVQQVGLEVLIELKQLEMLGDRGRRHSFLGREGDPQEPGLGVQPPLPGPCPVDGMLRRQVRLDCGAGLASAQIAPERGEDTDWDRIAGLGQGHLQRQG